MRKIAAGRIALFNGKLPLCNLFRKSIVQSFAEMPVELDRVHDCTPLEQGTGESPIPWPNLQHMPAFHVCDISYSLYSLGVNKEMLVVIRFHRDVNT
jgi:hypothetical protein